MGSKDMSPDNSILSIIVNLCPNYCVFTVSHYAINNLWVRERSSDMFPGKGIRGAVQSSFHQFSCEGVAHV